jgi:hypothetical protein
MSTDDDSEFCKIGVGLTSGFPFASSCNVEELHVERKAPSGKVKLSILDPLAETTIFPSLAIHWYGIRWLIFALKFLVKLWKSVAFCHKGRRIEIDLFIVL